MSNASLMSLDGLTRFIAGIPPQQSPVKRLTQSPSKPPQPAWVGEAAQRAHRKVSHFLLLLHSDCLAGSLAHWLFPWLIGSLAGSLAHSLSHCLITGYWLSHWLITGSFAVSLSHWLIGWLTGSFAVSLPHYWLLAVSLAHWLSHCLSLCLSLSLCTHASASGSHCFSLRFTASASLHHCLIKSTWSSADALTVWRNNSLVLNFFSQQVGDNV
jgi:hypothetical protein